MKTLSRWSCFHELAPFAASPKMGAHKGSVPCTFSFAALMMVCTLAFGQASSLADVKAKNGVQLSVDDLKQLMPSAKVTNQNAAGSTRNWENSAGGRLVASSDSKGGTGGRPYPVTASGSWKIDDRGTYCVTIQWNFPENWCRYVFKSGDRYYAFDTLEDTAQGSEFKFSK
jgi:hypothetical protein